jgi:hypothetical protein
LAFNNRGERKDAYDLYFTIKNYKNVVDDVFDHLKPLLDDPVVQNELIFSENIFLILMDSAP